MLALLPWWGEGKLVLPLVGFVEMILLKKEILSIKSS